MATVDSGRQHDSSTKREPIALEIFKRNRWCTVAKVTFLDGDRILAIAHRNQHGVRSTISVPLVILDYAEGAGCRWFYFRRDQTGQMWRTALVELRKAGWLVASDGVAEVFVKIDRMEPVTWRKWAYAKRTIKLNEADKLSERQLDLFAGVAM